MNIRTPRSHPFSSTEVSLCRGQLGVAVCLLLAGASIHAHDFQGISDSAALQNALTQSGDFGLYAGEDNIIWLEPGTYTTGAATNNSPFHYVSTGVGDLSIYGNAPTDTIIDGGHATEVFDINSALGGVTVLRVTIQNGESSGSGAGLRLNSGAGPHGSVDIDHTIIKNNHAAGFAGGLLVYTAGNFSGAIYENLIFGNSADIGYGAGIVTADSSGLFFGNNTVAQNSGPSADVAGGLYLGDATAVDCFVENNIFWNNTKFGLILASSHVLLYYNDIGTLSGTAPSDPIGNISKNPHFVDPVQGDFHLAGNSPVLGFSPRRDSLVTDLDGLFYSDSGRVDLGAYQESLFIDGFEGN